MVPLHACPGSAAAAPALLLLLPLLLPPLTATRVRAPCLRPHQPLHWLRRARRRNPELFECQGRHLPGADLCWIWRRNGRHLPLVGLLVGRGGEDLENKEDHVRWLSLSGTVLYVASLRGPRSLPLHGCPLCQRIGVCSHGITSKADIKTQSTNVSRGWRARSGSLSTACPPPPWGPMQVEE